MDITCLYEGRFKLAEGPVWCDRTQALWWVNMVDPPAVHRLTWQETTPQVFPAPAAVTGVALAQDSFVIVGTVGGLFRLDIQSGQFDPILRLDGDRPGNRCNEMGVDPQGNLWVGTMTNNLSGADVDPDAGAIFRITPDGQQQVVLDRLGIPNTLVWDDDGNLITADSMTGVIQRIVLDGSGMAADVSALHGPVDIGVPDGSALSVDGTLWNARWSGGCLIGISPEGTEIGRIEIPGGNITSAYFAGPNRDTLVVTTSLWGLSEDDLARAPQAGGIFAITGIGASGAPDARFSAEIGHWPLTEFD